MKQNRALDLAKFICAILIVIIHADPFGDYSKVLSYGFRNIICTIAVPFFFISNGYIFISKINSLSTNEEKWQYYKKYISRLIKMYLYWGAGQKTYGIQAFVAVAYESLIVTYNNVLYALQQKRHRVYIRGM